VDHERVTPETDKSAGAQECPPKKLKRSSMAVRNERQALERRTSSSSGNLDYAPEQANRLGSPTRVSPFFPSFLFVASVREGGDTVYKLTNENEQEKRQRKATRVRGTPFFFLIAL